MSEHRHHNHSLGHSHGHGGPTDAKRLGLTILLNMVITAAEFIGGVISGSLALLSDAAHNLSDVISLILAWFGAKGAEMKPRKRTTYGYKRLEVVTALINALSLAGISIYIIIEAFDRYSNPQPINGLIMLSVAAIGLLGNVFSVWILHRDRNRTINNRAAFLHMLYDAISSVAVIVGGIVILATGWYALDLILSILISVMILWSSLDILKEAAQIFMEVAPKGINIDEVKGAIEEIPGVTEAHHIHVWSISSSQVALSCHVVMSREDCANCTGVIRKIHEMLDREFHITHATIQPEGEVCPELPIVSEIPRKRKEA